MARVPRRPARRSRSRSRRRRGATILIFEKMFENRLFFVDKLVSMGARIILVRPAPRRRDRPGAALRAAAVEPRHPRRHGARDREPVRRGHARRSATSARSTAATSASTSACARSAPRSSASPSRLQAPLGGPCTLRPWRGRRPASGSSWRPRARRTSRPACPCSTTCVGELAATARHAARRSRSRPEAPRKRSTAARARARRRARGAAPRPAARRAAAGPPAGRRGARRRRRRDRGAAAGRLERRLLGPARRRARAATSSRASSRSSPTRRGLNVHVRLRRGKGHRARARGDLQGARRGARPGVPTRIRR